MKKLKLNFEMPIGTCDTHHHVYNPSQYPATPMKGFNWTPDKPPHLAQDYIALMQKTGITRNVIQACTCYGYNTDSDWDALNKIGAKNTRLITLLSSDLSDEALADLDKKGVRGVRVLPDNPETIKDVIGLAPRMKELNWNADFCLFSGKQFLAMEELIRQLPCEVVIAHQAMIHELDDPALADMIDLLKDNKIWVKLSALFRGSREPLFADNVRISQKLVEINPERLLWGTDWPFNFTDFCTELDTEAEGYGNDFGTLIKLIPEQMQDEAIREKILVKNPAELYGFKY